MRSRHRRFIGSIALAMAAMALALVLWPVARASAGEFEIYVSDKGNDESGNGTEGLPYASLAKAFDYIDDTRTINDHVTVYVLSDLTATSSARYWDANVTVIGKDGQWTITRDGEEFAGANDQNLGGYNGAMIEVGNSGSLTIENLILDDAGRSKGTHYVQVAPYDSDNDGVPDTGGSTYIGDTLVSNYDIVQDGIITTYSSDFKITLGENCQLKNFGGMSAVRVSGGTLVMESGSEIFDDDDSIKRKKQSNDYGYAGAVWVQSGTFTLEEGASIYDTSGHAVYADGDNSNVIINGTIENIESDNSNAWQGRAGGALHLRGGASATVNKTIQEITGGGSVVYITGGGTQTGSFTLSPNATIDGKGQNIVGVQIEGNNGIYVNINGKITGMADSAIHVNNNANNDPANPETMHLTIGPNGIITGNTGGYGNVTIQTNGGTVDIYGKIVENSSNQHSGLCMANNKKEKTVFLHNGAEISRNYSTGGIAGVRVSLGTLYMEDGAKVEGNISTKSSSYGDDGSGAGIVVLNGGKFHMNGGSIKDNASTGIGGGVKVRTDGDSFAQLNGGSISGGLMGATITTDNGTPTVSDGTSSDLAIVGGNTYGNTSRYLSVSDEVSLSEQSIFMDDYDFYLENLGDDVKLGNASKAAEDAATTAYENEGLTEVVGSFWYATDGAAREFSITGLNNYDMDKPLYAAVMKTNASGAAVDGSNTLRSVKVNDDGILSLSLPGQSAEGYAVVFLQQAPDINIVSIIPADVTVYEGGEGYTAVVGDNGEIKTDSSMPHPLFRIEGIENADGLVFSNGTKNWTVAHDVGNYYHFEPGNNQDNVRVTYTDAAGNKVTSDKFEVPKVKDTFAQFTIGLYLGENTLDDIKITNSNYEDYEIVLGTGTLTVRAVQDNPSKVVSSVIDQDSLEPQKSGEAVAVAPVGTTYTLNNIGVALPDDAKPSLLFDDIIDGDGHERTSALVDAIKAQFGSTVDEGCYQAKYLDLVDANNSNAWIKASEGVTVYWGYPKGTDTSTNFTLYHFEGLHRDGANSGYDVSDINTAEIKPVEVDNTEKGIAFTVERGGFSPFVLVWDRPSGGTVIPPAATHTITATAGSGGSISPSGEVTVTEGFDQAFAITPDEGNKVRDVTIDGKSVGALGSYTFEDVRGDHTISVTFTRGNAPADPDDTGVSDWFETGDHDAFMHGYDDGTGRFGPDDNMTRGEAAQMFYNMLKDKSRGDVQFDFEDLSEGAWYYEAVATMASHGILLGTSPTTVEPERPITRAEFTAMAMRFSKGDLSGENIFTDVSEGDWYYGVIVGSIKYGWISGYDDGTGRFGPNDNITRAQATTIANRMLGRVADGVFVSAHLDEIRRFPDVDEGFYAFLDIAEATNSHDYAKDGGFEHWSALR